jgi:hypothetical protein
MISEICKEWLMIWDVELQRKSRKLLLVLDNWAAHPNSDCLKTLQHRTHCTANGHRNHAKKFIAGLRVYFMQEGNEGRLTSAPETCDDFVQLQSIKRTRQGTVDQFLQHY